MKYVEQLPLVDAKIRMVNHFLDSLKQLKDRSNCPLCRNEISRKEVDNEIMLLSTKLKEYEGEYKKQIEENKPIVEKKRLERQKNEEMENKLVNEYIEKNASVFRKIIREFRKDDESFRLPNIPDKDKRIWNKAIDKFIGNSKAYDDLDEHDFQYDI